MTDAVREEIEGVDVVRYADLDPTVDVRAIAGVRIYDVGQGDAICVLDHEGKPFLQIDYGGKFGHPFRARGAAARRMPLDGVRLMMLTHWDEDHWCSAAKNKATLDLPWLVPRQRTSPRAARFSATVRGIHCIPESDVHTSIAFEAVNRDCILFEKIDPMPAADQIEDCNRTGVAFAIVNRKKEAILLPGDAPYDKVKLFGTLQANGVKLRAIVAFHYGSRKHWTQATRDHLRAWKGAAGTRCRIFSYGEGNTYDHPTRGNYDGLRGVWTTLETPDLRMAGRHHVDILF